MPLGLPLIFWIVVVLILLAMFGYECFIVGRMMAVDSIEREAEKRKDERNIKRTISPL